MLSGFYPVGRSCVFPGGDWFFGSPLLPFRATLIKAGTRKNGESCVTTAGVSAHVPYQHLSVAVIWKINFISNAMRCVSLVHYVPGGSRFAHSTPTTAGCGNISAILCADSQNNRLTYWATRKALRAPFANNKMIPPTDYKRGKSVLCRGSGNLSSIMCPSDIFESMTRR